MEKKPDWNEKKILIVEDDEISFIYLNEILEETGATIIRAENGRQAINMYKENPQVDIILMDLQLPKLSGFDATKQIKKINANVPIIAQTAFAMKGDKERALEAGCDDYITKPIDHAQALQVINKYI